MDASKGKRTKSISAIVSNHFDSKKLDNEAKIGIKGGPKTNNWYMEKGKLALKLYETKTSVWICRFLKGS